MNRRSAHRSVEKKSENKKCGRELFLSSDPIIDTKESNVSFVFSYSFQI
jgi:hypothetical protein